MRGMTSGLSRFALVSSHTLMGAEGRLFSFKRKLKGIFLPFRAKISKMVTQSSKRLMSPQGDRVPCRRVPFRLGERPVPWDGREAVGSPSFDTRKSSRTLPGNGDCAFITAAPLTCFVCIWHASEQ